MLSDALNHAYLFELVDGLSSKSPTTTLTQMKEASLLFALPKDMDATDLDPADPDDGRTDDEAEMLDRVAIILKVDTFHYIIIDCEDLDIEGVVPLAVIEEKFHNFMDLQALADEDDVDDSDDDEDEDEDEDGDSTGYEMGATLASGREVTVSWGYDDDGEVVLDAEQSQELSDAEKAELIKIIEAADAEEEDSPADTDTGYVEGGHQMMNIFVMLQGLSMLEENIRRMATDDMTWLWPVVTEDTPAVGTLFFARTRDDQFLLFQAVSSTEALVLSPSSTLYGSVIPFGLLFEGPDFKNFLFDAAVDLAMRRDPEDEEDDEFGDEDDEEDEGEDDFDEDYVPPPPGSKRTSK